MTVCRIQILAINRHRSLIGIWHSTGLLLPQYWLLLLVKYRQVNYANLRHSTGLLLAVNRIQILSINRNRNLIDSWRSVGLLLVQYWLSLLAKYRQRRYANLRHSTGWVLAVYIIQHPNTGYQPTWKSRRQLAVYWFTNSTTLIIYHYWQIADVLFSQPFTYLFLPYPFKMYFCK